MSLLTALRHNRREIQAELGSDGAIDASRTHLNVTLHGEGSADCVAKAARQRLSGLGFTPSRRDYLQAIELLISLPQETEVDVQSYFAASLAWACSRYGTENIVSADIHLDEAAPHCHILVLPVKGGAYAGRALLGNKGQLRAMRTSFIQTVANPFGLRAAPEAPRGAARQKMAAQVLAELAHTKDPVLRSTLWPLIKQDIEKAPLSHHTRLGLPPPESPPKRLKTMAEIFTSPGKGPRREIRPCAPLATRPQKLAQHLKPIPLTAWQQFNQGQHLGIEGVQSLSCVGFGQNTAMDLLLAGRGEGNAGTGEQICGPRQPDLSHKSPAQSMGLAAGVNASTEGACHAQ